MFAFETRRIVSRSKIDNVVDDVVKLLEYPKGFPQEHLMLAGQLLLNLRFLSKIAIPLNDRAVKT
jgi:hypothetical protein